jgi:hypothetical protein
LLIRLDGIIVLAPAFAQKQINSSGLGFRAGLPGLGFLGLVFLGGSVYKATASNAGGLPP